MKYKIYILFIAFFLIKIGTAQTPQDTIIFTGRIVDSNNKPIKKAKVFLDSIETKVKINKKGFFQVDVPTTVKKIFVYSKKHGLLGADYNNDNALTFMFLENNKNVEELDDGFKLVKKENLTVGIDKLDGKKMDKVNYTSIFDMIRGQVPGVRVSGNQITIRGQNSINPENTTPLFLVDDVFVSDISNISPFEVQSITFLKGTSAAIYGNRGANGVIKIKTVPR